MHCRGALGAAVPRQTRTIITRLFKKWDEEDRKNVKWEVFTTASGRQFKYPREAYGFTINDPDLFPHANPKTAMTDRIGFPVGPNAPWEDTEHHRKVMNKFMGLFKVSIPLIIITVGYYVVRFKYDYNYARSWM